MKLTGREIRGITILVILLTAIILYSTCDRDGYRLPVQNIPSPASTEQYVNDSARIAAMAERDSIAAASRHNKSASKRTTGTSGKSANKHRSSGQGKSAVPDRNSPLDEAL